MPRVWMEDAQVWVEDAPGMDGRCPGYGWMMPWVWMEDAWVWTEDAQVWTEDAQEWTEDAPSFCKREAQTWFIGPWMLLGESKRKQQQHSSSPHGPYLSCDPNRNTVMGLYINFRKFHIIYFNHIPTPSFSQIASSSLSA